MSDDEIINTRRAPHMERYVKIVRFGNHYAITLQIGVQSFRIGYVMEEKPEAEWWRDMLCIALDELVKMEKANG